MESTDEDLKVWLNEIGEEYTLKTLERFHWVFEKGTFGGRKETKGGQRDNYDLCSFRSVIFACDTRE